MKSNSAVPGGSFASKPTWSNLGEVCDETLDYGYSAFLFKGDKSPATSREV
jgi:hypothetical protein